MDKHKYMVSTREKDANINVFVFASDIEIEFDFWGKNNRLCHTVILSCNKSDDFDDLAELFLLVLYNGKTWKIDEFALIEAIKKLRDHIYVRIYDNPIKTLCHLFYAFLPCNPIGTLFQEKLDQLAMAVLENKITGICHDVTTASELMGLPYTALQKLNTEECLRFVSDTNKRNILNRAIIHFSVEEDTNGAWKEHQIRYLLECYQYDRSVYSFDVFRFIGTLNTTEAVRYYLYRQKRAVLDLPYLPLVPHTPVELLRLERATDITLHLLSLPGLRLKLTEHQNLHKELVQSERGFFFAFLRSIEDMYVNLAEKFLPLEWINEYLERIYKGGTHSELVMVLRKSSDGGKEEVIMCVIIQSDNTIMHIALKDIPEAAADDIFAFFDKIIQKNHLCYSPFFTRRVV